MPSSTQHHSLDSSSELSHQVSSPNAAVVIDPQGDLLLNVSFYNDLSQQYRVSISVLRDQSSYFSVLLDSTKFSEGIAVESRLADLKKLHEHMNDVSLENLPSVTISDIGVGSRATGDLCETAFRLCLQILHDSPELPVGKKARVRFVCAVLAHYAEVFAVLPAVSKYYRRCWQDRISRSYDPFATKATETNIRQELYIGLLLGLPHTVEVNSAALIVLGSGTWFDAHDDSNIADNDRYPWDYLTGGVEEELACRRHCVIKTISSIQDYFIAAYSSRGSQCKLRYDSSLSCDAFQLGEMLRFFTRKGTLNLQCTLSGEHDKPEAYRGSLLDLLKAMKECPTYQVDRNHTHCGLRAGFLPRLRAVDPERQGLCLQCWRNDRSNESWLENPSKGAWFYGVYMWDRKKGVGSPCAIHRRAKKFYTASRRDWTEDKPS